MSCYGLQGNLRFLRWGGEREEWVREQRWYGHGGLLKVGEDTPLVFAPFVWPGLGMWLVRS